MVERDARDDRKQRVVHDVRGIEPAAHPAFEHDDINFCTFEILEPDRRDQFELRGQILHRIRERTNESRHLGKHFAGNILPVRLDALTKLLYIGRGEHSNAVTGLHQHGGEHRAERALAVRSRDVDHLHPLFGISHSGEQLRDPLQPRPAALPAGGMDVFERFVIVHALLLLYGCRRCPLY